MPKQAVNTSIAQQVKNHQADPAASEDLVDTTGMQNLNMSFDEHGDPIKDPAGEPSAKVNPEQEARQIQEPQEFKIGEKTFASVEEALAYAEETQAAKAKAQQESEALKAAILEQRKAEQGSESEKSESESKFSDLLFEDPEKAIELIQAKTKEDVLNEVFRAHQQQKNEDFFWNQLYTNYPRLKGREDLVQAILEQNWERLKPLPLDQSLPLIHELAIKRAKLYAELVSPQTQMPAGQAITAPTQTVTLKEPDIKDKTGDVLDFTSQMRQLRKKRN